MHIKRKSKRFLLPSFIVTLALSSVLMAKENISLIESSPQASHKHSFAPKQSLTKTSLKQPTLRQKKQNPPPISGAPYSPQKEPVPSLKAVTKPNLLLEQLSCVGVKKKLKLQLGLLKKEKIEISKGCYSLKKSIPHLNKKTLTQETTLLTIKNKAPLSYPVKISTVSKKEPLFPKIERLQKRSLNQNSFSLKNPTIAASQTQSFSLTLNNYEFSSFSLLLQFKKHHHKGKGSLPFREFAFPRVNKEILPHPTSLDAFPNMKGYAPLITRNVQLSHSRKVLLAHSCPIKENGKLFISESLPSLPLSFTDTLPFDLKTQYAVKMPLASSEGAKTFQKLEKPTERRWGKELFKKSQLPRIAQLSPFTQTHPSSKPISLECVPKWKGSSLNLPSDFFVECTESLSENYLVEMSNLLKITPEEAPSFFLEKPFLSRSSNSLLEKFIFPKVALKVPPSNNPKFLAFTVTPLKVSLPNTKKLLWVVSLPEEERTTTFSLKNIPEIPLDLSNSLLSHLETDKKPSFELATHRIVYKKEFETKLNATPINESTLPQIPLAIFSRQTATPLHKVTEDLPEIQSLLTLIPRETFLPNTKKIASDFFLPSREGKFLVPTEGRLQNPLFPGHYPPEIPSLALDSISLEVTKKPLEYLKEYKKPEGTGINHLALPYLREKGVMPNKHPFISSQSFSEELFPSEIFFEVASRPSPFSNIQNLLSKAPLPSITDPKITLDTETIHNPEVAMIRSQSKEILEHYEQETEASPGGIALSKPAIQSTPSESEVHAINKSSRFTNAFLTEIPPPSYLETATYNNEFETEVHYTKREDGKGYYFALKIRPNAKLCFGAPNQHIIFVVDGSSSIKKQRFGVFKEGVERALPYLNEGDAFNIIVADSQLTPLSKTPVKYTKNNITKAKQFLNERNYRGFFINYDAFDLLSKVTNYFDPERENVIILLTDGHSFNTLKHHKEDFQQLANASKGRFSIFTATASQNNNLSMLDLVSAFNGGELLYSKTNAAFSRQLARLVKHIEHFIAKDIRIHTTSHKQESGIEFYPSENSLPALYFDRPYFVYGTIDELKDFDLILQGRSGDQWINIKQHITFKDALKAPYSIQKGFALQQAYICYDYFLKKDNPFFLSEAERILDPFSIPTVTR